MQALTKKAKFWAHFQAFEAHNKKPITAVRLNYSHTMMAADTCDTIVSTDPTELRSKIEAILSQCDDNLRFIETPTPSA